VRRGRVREDAYFADWRSRAAQRAALLRWRSVALFRSWVYLKNFVDS
jgi:hypothetical protein